MRPNLWLKKGVPVAGALLLLEACGLKSIQKPNLFGPSELALSLNLTATPDIVTADNHSLVHITVIARDRNGQPAPNTPLTYALFEQGTIVSLGTLVKQVGDTDANGVDHNLYIAPARTDADAQLFLDIGVRAEQGDANEANYRTVTIEIRPPEPGIFPGAGKPPNCSFVVEGGFSFGRQVQVLFQDSSTDPNTGGKIVRYQWDFGDGNAEEGPPDVNHGYNTTGTFTVTHQVTDNLGGSAVCTATLTIF